LVFRGHTHPEWIYDILTQIALTLCADV
jgi:hypothetical protein